MIGRNTSMMENSTSGKVIKNAVFCVRRYGIMQIQMKEWMKILSKSVCTTFADVLFVLIARTEMTNLKIAKWIMDLVLPKRMNSYRHMNCIEQIEIITEKSGHADQRKVRTNENGY